MRLFKLFGDALIEVTLLFQVAILHGAVRAQSRRGERVPTLFALVSQEAIDEGEKPSGFPILPTTR